MAKIKSLFLSRTVWMAIIQLLLAIHAAFKPYVELGQPLIFKDWFLIGGSVLAAIATIIFRAQARTITFTPEGLPGLDKADAARIVRSN